METEQLKPCPFCGASARVVCDRLGESVYVECSACGAEGKHYSRFLDELDAAYKAVGAWNKRTNPSELTIDNAPIGTTAPSCMGGRWYRTERGWKWNGPSGDGGTFPRPGGDWNGKLIEPQAEHSNGERANFEAWFKHRYPDHAYLLARSGDQYRIGSTEIRWDTWKGARASQSGNVSRETSAGQVRS